MAKLGHKAWVADQFRNGRPRKRQYRDAVLHASFIEGIVRKNCTCQNRTHKKSKRWNCKNKKPTFECAIEWLFNQGKIKTREKNALDAVRKRRNDLVHHIIELKAYEGRILAWRDDLIKKLEKAYTISAFLRTELSREYRITWPREERR
ncbi:MAG: DUF4145 domain-containing protein [Phycisphaerales bacterium]